MSHEAITGWTRLRSSHQMTSFPNDLAIGVANYLILWIKPEMGLAVPLMYDCHLWCKELQSHSHSWRGSVCYRVWGEENRLITVRNTFWKNQSVIVCVKLVHEPLIWRLQKIDDLDWKRFLVSQYVFGKHIHKVMQENLVLENPGFIITVHCFHRGGATRTYMLKRLSLSELNDRGWLKIDSTL